MAWAPPAPPSGSSSGSTPVWRPGGSTPTPAPTTGNPLTDAVFGLNKTAHHQGGVTGLLSEAGHMIQAVPSGLGYVAGAILSPKNLAWLNPSDTAKKEAIALAGGRSSPTPLGNLTRETGASFKRTGEDIRHPTHFARAYKEGHLLGRLLEDLTNVTIVAGPLSKGLSASALGARQAAEAAAKDVASATAEHVAAQEAVDKAMAEAAATGNAAMASGATMPLREAVDAAAKKVADATEIHKAAQAAADASEWRAQLLERAVHLGEKGAAAPFYPLKLGKDAVTWMYDAARAARDAGEAGVVSKAAAAAGDKVAAAATKLKEGVAERARKAYDRKVLDAHWEAMHGATQRFIFDQTKAAQMRTDLLRTPKEQIVADMLFMRGDGLTIAPALERMLKNGQAGAELFDLVTSAKEAELGLPEGTYRLLVDAVAGRAKEFVERAKKSADIYEKLQLPAQTDAFIGAMGEKPMTPEELAGYQARAEWQVSGNTPDPVGLERVQRGLERERAKLTKRLDKSNAAAEKAMERTLLTPEQIANPVAARAEAMRASQTVAEGFVRQVSDQLLNGPLPEYGDRVIDAAAKRYEAGKISQDQFVQAVAERVAAGRYRPPTPIVEELAAQLPEGLTPFSRQAGSLRSYESAVGAADRYNLANKAYEKAIARWTDAYNKATELGQPLTQKAVRGFRKEIIDGLRQEAQDLMDHLNQFGEIGHRTMWSAPPGDLIRTNKGTGTIIGRRAGGGGEYDWTRHLSPEVKREFFAPYKSAGAASPELVVDRIANTLFAGDWQQATDYLAETMQKIVDLKRYAREGSQVKGFYDPEASQYVRGLWGPDHVWDSQLGDMLAGDATAADIAKAMSPSEARLLRAAQNVSAAEAAAASAQRQIEKAYPRASRLPEERIAAMAKVEGTAERQGMRAGRLDERANAALRDLRASERTIVRFEERAKRTIEAFKADAMNAPARYRPALMAAHSWSRALDSVIYDIREVAGPQYGAGLEEIVQGIKADLITTLDDAVRKDVSPLYVQGGKSLELGGSRVPRTSANTVQVESYRRTGARVKSFGSERSPRTIPEQTMDVMNRMHRRLTNEMGFAIQRDLGAKVTDLLAKPAEEWGLDPKLSDQELAAEGFARHGENIVPAAALTGGPELSRLMDEAGYLPWSNSFGNGIVPPERVTPNEAWIPKEIHRTYMKRYGELPEPNKFVQIVDRGVGKWKHSVLALSPRWHVNNIAGNAFVAMGGAGIDPFTLARGWRIAAHLLLGDEKGQELAARLTPESRATLHEFNGAYYAAPEITHRGFSFATGSMATDTMGPKQIARIRAENEWAKGLSDTEVKQAWTQREALSGGSEIPKGAWNKLKHPIKTSYALNGFVDDMNRVAIALTQADKLDAAGLAKLRESAPWAKGLDDAEIRRTWALRESLRAAGDFTKMTRAERNIVKRIFTFYPWLRHITKLSYDLVKNHPVRTAWILRLGMLGDEAPLPFLEGATPVTIGGKGYYVRPSAGINPFHDVLGLVGVDDTGAPLSPAGLLASVSPAVSLPAAMLGIDLRNGSLLSRPPGTHHLDAYGRATFTLAHPLEALYLAGSAFPQVDVARQVLPALRGHNPVVRYPTGQKVLSGGHTIPTSDSPYPRALNPLLRLLGIPTVEAVDVAKTLAIAEKRRQAEQTAGERYRAKAGSR